MVNKSKLTKREYDIMEILWKFNEPLPASEIQNNIPELSINSVLLIVKRLINKNYVYVAKISQSGKVLMREFSPCLSKEQYMPSLMDQKTLMHLASSFIQQCDDMDIIDMLQQEIDKKKSGM